MRPALRSYLPVGLAILAAVPAFLLRFGGLMLPVELATLGFGLGVVGAAFCMLWAAEAAERDVPRALALTAVALLEVGALGLTGVSAPAARVYLVWDQVAPCSTTVFSSVISSTAQRGPSLPMPLPFSPP
jgi:hypothetical protein